MGMERGHDPDPVIGKQRRLGRTWVGREEIQTEWKRETHTYPIYICTVDDFPATDFHV